MPCVILALTPTLTLTLALTLSPALTLHQAIPAALHRVPAPPKAASRLSMPFFARAHPGALRPLTQHSAALPPPRS